jgi:hypothetical protein
MAYNSLATKTRYKSFDGIFMMRIGEATDTDRKKDRKN